MPPQEKEGNAQFNIIRSQKYQDRKAIIIDHSRNHEVQKNELAEARLPQGKFAPSTFKSNIVDMRALKVSDYGNQPNPSHSIDRTLAGHNHVNLHNFRKTQNLTLRLNQRPQRLDHLNKKRNNGQSIHTSIAQSKTAPTSAQIGDVNGSQQSNPMRALSLQNDMHNRYSTAADRYRTEVSNIVSQHSQPHHSLVSAHDLSGSQQYPKYGGKDPHNSSLTKQAKPESTNSQQSSVVHQSPGLQKLNDFYQHDNKNSL